MSTLPVRLRTSPEACTEPGDAFHDSDAGSWWLFLPGDQDVTEWPYRTPLANGASWRWNGSETAPTLNPSLHLRIGGETVWHGWLRGGVLLPV